VSRRSDNSAPLVEPVTFATVLSAEVTQISAARDARGVPSEKTGDSLIGLAFSGGGIRSATFNLGFLQAMARERLLHKFDYLSTVSGGGYIGSWLAAVTYRFLQSKPDAGFQDVEAALIPEEYKTNLRRERSFLHWLRMYSNYLTPNAGLISGDTWAMIGTWLRNAFLNQTIFGLFSLGVFAFFQGLLLLLAKSRSYADALLVCGAVLLFIAAISMALSIADQKGFWQVIKPNFFQRTKVTTTVMLPYLAASIFLNTGLWRWPALADLPIGWWLGVGAAFYFLVWGSVSILVWLRRRRRALDKDEVTPEISISALLIFSPISGLVGGALLWAYVTFLVKPRACTTVYGCGGVNWAVVILGTAVVMLTLLAVGAIHLGLTGRGCRDLVREWWARLGGYMMLVTLGWLAVAGICAFGPLFLRWIFFKLGAWKSMSAAGLWALHNYLGVRAANSATVSGKKKGKSDDPKESPSLEKDQEGWLERIVKSPMLLNAIAQAAPYVFAFGLLLGLATVVQVGGGAYFDPQHTQKLWQSNDSWSPCCGGAGASAPTPVDWAALCQNYWAVQYHGHAVPFFLAALVLIVAASALSWRVDVNDFSLHHFYRNRLVRCYLGASNASRRPQAFTAFDPRDDIDLKDFGAGYPGPFPILNAALNITTGEELGYATRRAKSFVFTPLYCGYEVNAPGNEASWFERTNPTGEAFEPTYSLTSDGRTAGNITKIESYGGISLGTAMAISGAAASPNMGYYTSVATGLFMTLFDVRLGWWMGNPRYPWKWRSPGPAFGLGYLFSELVAQSDQKKSYVYLSDGGHFENLAVYELLKRHCKVIVACDADADPKYCFENLLALIEKARVDTGAEIVVPCDGISPAANMRECGCNYVVGDIFYDPQNPLDRGKFIYIKAGLPKRPENARRESGEENLLPDDVRAYAAKHKTFPHESTADQWFDELQFESYRALGEFIGRSAAEAIRKEITTALA